MEDTEDIHEITPAQVDWPALLRHIPHPPKRLFVRGTWPPRFADGMSVNKDTKFLCVVGARKHTSYGREVCEALIAGLAGYNICIVSGLALGIDAISHEAALNAGLATIAFPGSGLKKEVLYPPRNFRLAKRIIDAGGVLLSEYEPDAPTMPWYFPERNRLMAGISHAILVIEAKRPSGTLITSRLAQDYARDVFTVPGDIFSALSAGPHMLIQQGAALIASSEDILHELGIKPREEIDSTKTTNNQSSLFETIRGETEQERLICSIILDCGGKATSDEIISAYSKTKPSNVSEIMATLSLMEMNGIIREKNGLFALRFGSV